ncbi:MULTISPECIES: hypothetical protein [unclassified Pseudoalteromonas]|uniref:hypothetical protein n=1 Tax=unclassified Pseudoalteromonas TaxID=194690 RepID=UPI0025B30C99|nr:MULTISPECIES: hypothetical protein [unclassified Pseudoalteromonas]MDN3378509.1 hypothetical protein [Pseudoalteromonas sp. APC 3893]MDN3387078.1 hypothetical protein [Pseudoalteromonas sp. APC 4017]
MMGSYPLLSFILICALFIIQNRKYNALLTHLAQTHPTQWEQLAQNTLGDTSHCAVAANFNESLKNGFFSTLDDPKISQFKKLKTINMTICFALTVLGLTIAYIY